MSTRTLISDTGQTRTYQVYDDDGNPIGTDTEWVPTEAELNARSIRDRATAALDLNAAFLDNPAPTSEELLAQVVLVTRECSALIRWVLDELDSLHGVDPTPPA